MQAHSTPTIPQLQPIPTVSTSKLFGVYNKARSLRARSLGVERKRANRALGIALRGKVRLLGTNFGLATGSHGEEYLVTLSSCQCKDYQYRGGLCKHRLGLMYLVKAGATPAPVTLDELIPGRHCACDIALALVDEPGPWHGAGCVNHRAPKRTAWVPTPTEQADLDAEIDALWGER